MSTLLGQVKPSCRDEIQTVDFPAVLDWINPKRTLTYLNKEKNLKLKGDIRTDFLFRRERMGNLFLRGGNAHDKNNIAIPSDQLAVKMNLKADYQCDEAWLVTQIEFDNNMGIQQLNRSCKEQPQLLFGSGFCDYLCLKRAYVGYVFWTKGENKEERLYMEFGRRSLYYVFDSRIQFKARVDGIWLKYSNTFQKYEEDRSSNYYAILSSFLVNKKDNHFGYAAETGIFNVCDTGFDWKLSFINWRLNGKNQCGVQDPLGWRFSNVQITGDYNFKERFWGKKLNLYGAFLINLAASHVSFTIEQGENNDIEVTPIVNPQKENKGWYLGFIFGEVKKQGDFSFDCNYQYVEAQAVSDCDIRGIGRGNSRKESFPRDRRGNSNYKGIHTELLYAITDKLSLDISMDLSRPVDRKIGAIDHRYGKFEVEFIHSF